MSRDTPRAIGLRILLWIATHLLRGSLTDDEKEELKRLRTSLHIMREFER